MSDELTAGGDEDCCYLRTRGRRSGRPHEIEIWFVGDGDTLYLLAGGGDRSDWVGNLRAEPAVTVRVGGVTSAARARVVEGGTAEDGHARRLVFEKYQGRSGGDLRHWRDAALPVALDLQS